jgi:hypothetical protein
MWMGGLTAIDTRFLCHEADAGLMVFASRDDPLAEKLRPRLLRLDRIEDLVGIVAGYLTWGMLG